MAKENNAGKLSIICRLINSPPPLAAKAKLEKLKNKRLKKTYRTIFNITLFPLIFLIKLIILVNYSFDFNR